VSKKPRNIIS